MKGKSLTMLAVGDLILEKPDGEFYLSPVAPVLRTGDVVVGNGEIVFTDRGIATYVEMYPSPGCPSGNMGALASAGFNVITLASNHVYDRGAPGIEDTVAGLRGYGIAVTGAGMNVDEARAPAIIERDGTKFGFLSYNCVGAPGQWATFDKPGCAYVHIISHYETATNPGGTCDVYTFAEPRSLKAMEADVRKLRPLCDVLVVAFHKGIGSSTKLAMYDQQVAYAAIDAGADLILGHHAHMLKGIENYKGKAIFHGLGQFVPVVAGLTDAQIKERRISRPPNLSGVYNIQQTPDQYLTMIAKFLISDKKISRLSNLPVLVNEQRQPEVVKHDHRGQQVFDFMEMLNKEEDLNTGYEWEDDEVVVRLR